MNTTDAPSSFVQLEATMTERLSYLAHEPDHTAPNLSRLVSFLTQPESLLRGRFVVHGNTHGNTILAKETQHCQHPIQVHFHNGCTGNIIIIGAESEIFGSIHIHGNDNCVIIGESIRQWSMLNIRMWSHRQTLFWGNGSTSNGVEVVMQGDGGRVTVADDCMFANNIFIRNSDMHPMVDIRSRRRLNPPADVSIESHVWVAQDSLILKGTKIGRGSIVSAKTLANRSCPPFSLIGGSPGRLLRSDVTWDRPEFPRWDVIDRLTHAHLNVPRRSDPT